MGVASAAVVHKRGEKKSLGMVVEMEWTMTNPILGVMGVMGVMAACTCEGGGGVGVGRRWWEVVGGGGEVVVRWWE